MKKFCVFSGFLGSGKTTAMMALIKYFTARHGKAECNDSEEKFGGRAGARTSRLRRARRARPTIAVARKRDLPLQRIHELAAGGEAVFGGLREGFR